jgi:hypothetical protein
MVTHMKTTIEIADALLDQARTTAAREGITVRALVEEGLRTVLKQRGARRTRFQLRDASFRGEGLQAGVDLADWNAVAATIYKDRGA